MSQTVVTTGLDQQMKKSFSHWFILSAGAILAITGIAKIWSGLGDSKFLTVVDPIIGIKFGPLMFAVATIEIAIALVCFFSKRQTMVLALVAWLSTTFLVYRLGLWWMDWKSPCGCLGNLTDALHVSPQTADGIMKAVLAYLLIGSCGFLLSFRWKIHDRDHNWSAIKLVLTLLVAFFLPHSMKAQDFEAVGIITNQIFGPGASTRIGKFQVIVSNSESLISVSNYGSYNLIQMALSNGVFYSMQSYYSRDSSEIVTNTATVKFRKVPEDDGGGLNYLWLAFGSSQYFAIQTTNYLQPLWMLDDPRLTDSFLFKADWKLLNGWPNLPQEVTYWNDGNYRTQNQSGESKIFRAPPPFDQGYTNAFYQVYSTTNIGVAEIPSEAQFSRYYIFNGKLETRTYCGFKVTSFNTTPPAPSVRPVFSGAASVVDFRFSKSNPPVQTLVYKTKANTWPELNEISSLYRTKAKFQQVSQMRRTDVDRAKVSTRWVIGLVLLLVSLSFLAVIWRINKHN